MKSLASVLSSALFGVVFGVGLIVSGMTDPARVKGFLDVTGEWNPALALVMAGAIAVALPAFAIARRRGTSLLGQPIPPSERTGVDARLLAGAAIFGAGWGLSGICPAPALVLLGQDLTRAGAFVAALVVGAWIGGLGTRGRGS
jgi:uncharacterized membrane protein YedE/YeeE